MPIQEDHLNYLTQYCLDVKEPTKNESEESLQSLSKTLTFIREELDTIFHLDKLGERLSQGDLVSDSKLQADLKKFTGIVDKISLQTNGDYDFNIHHARKVAGQIQYKTIPTKVFDVRDTTETGVREKFILQELDKNTHISEVDIKRFLYESGIYDNVHVASIDQDILSGMFMDIEAYHHHDIEPYNVNLLLSNKEEDDEYWVSLILHVDPFKRSIDFTIRNNTKLSDVVQQELIMLFKSAIRTGYSPDELWRINETEVISARVWQERESGLAALYDLLQDPVILDNSDLASNFANCRAGTDELYKEFITTQLQTLIITPNIYNHLADDMKSKFLNYRLKNDSIRSIV